MGFPDAICQLLGSSLQCVVIHICLHCVVPGHEGHMKTNRTPRWVVIVLILPTISPRLMGQDRNASTVGPFDVTPIASYGSGMSFAMQPMVPGKNPRLVLNASPSYGFAFGARLREGDLIEFRWSRQDSYAEIRDASLAFPRTRITLNQLHCDFSHEYVIQHPAHWIRPFIIASVGATNMAAEATSGSNYLSAGIGGGVKLLVSRRVGFRFQVLWLSTLIDPHGIADCGSGCQMHFAGILGSQAELTLGPVFRF
jgi:hypothetical protein